MIDSIQTAQNSLNKHFESFASTTERVASGETDLAADAVQVKIDSLGIQYNVAMIKQANEMSETLLDLFA